MAHLTLQQRQLIASGISAGKSNGQIAHELGVHVSTVGREIKRNSPERGAYGATLANVMAASRQIQAAKDRFSGTGEKCQPNASALKNAPYTAYHIPPLRYMRPCALDALSFHTTPRHYFYDQSQYYFFFRCFKAGGQARLSGLNRYSELLRWDYRTKSPAPATYRLKLTFATAQDNKPLSPHSFSSVAATPHTKHPLWRVTATLTAYELEKPMVKFVLTAGQNAPDDEQASSNSAPQHIFIQQITYVKADCKMQLTKIKHSKHDSQYFEKPGKPIQYALAF